MRADARKRYNDLLTVARAVIGEQGATASLRDIARKAGVGLAILYRHFPTHDALLVELFSKELGELTQQAGDLDKSSSPDEALVSWFRNGVCFAPSCRGVVDLMTVAIEDPQSALHVSCVAVRSAGGRFLARANAEGTARTSIDGDNLFALMAALGWLGEQSAFAPRADHLVDVVAGTLVAAKPTKRPSGGTGKRIAT